MTDDMKKQLGLLKDLLLPRDNNVYGARASRCAEEEMEKDFNDRARPPPVIGHRREMVKIFNSLSHRHDQWRVFSDACEVMAMALGNPILLATSFEGSARRQTYEKREARYHEIRKGYSKDEFDEFPQLLSHLIEAMEAEPSDILGSVFHELELHNKWSGQFFTPWPVARMMAQMTIGDRADLEAKIRERGFVTVCEPAAGSGVMVMALAETMRDMGINYQQHLHATLVDVDPKCVHMAYAQLSLMHIPAVIVHGNTLSMQEWDHWHTPAHIMGFWDSRLRRRFDAADAHKIETIPTPEAVDGPMAAPQEQVIGLLVEQAVEMSQDKSTVPLPAQLSLF